MPASAISVVVAVVFAFLTFIVVVGGVSIWSEWPERRRPAPNRRAARADGRGASDHSGSRTGPRVPG